MPFVKMIELNKSNRMPGIVLTLKSLYFRESAYHSMLIGLFPTGRVSRIFRTIDEHI